MLKGGAVAKATAVGAAINSGEEVTIRETPICKGLLAAPPALSSTALINVQERDSGVASAVLNSTQQVGASLGAALLNTIAATATASYIASHGPRLQQEALVHGFSRALGVGAAIVAAGAVVSAVLVNAKATNPAAAAPDLAPSAEPAFGEG